MRTGGAVAVAIAMASGCAHVPRAVDLGAATPSAPEEYRIHPGDELDVRFIFNPELNEHLTVRPDGRISLPLLRDVVAAGLTPNELTDRLEALSEKHLNKPEVAVIVRSFAAHRIFVDGEVNKPGVVGLVGPTTVLQSIALAGGLRDTAASGSVILIRRGVGTKPVVMTVNVHDALDGSDLRQDVPLQPNDVVYVPKSAIANVNQWVDQYIRKNIPLPVYVPLQVSF